MGRAWNSFRSFKCLSKTTWIMVSVDVSTSSRATIGGMTLTIVVDLDHFTMEIWFTMYWRLKPF